MLFIGAVVILYLVPSSKARFGFISLSTITFAPSIALLINTRRTGVFGVMPTYVEASLMIMVDPEIADRVLSMQRSSSCSSVAIWIAINQRRSFGRALIHHTDRISM